MGPSVAPYLPPPVVEGLRGDPSPRSSRFPAALLLSDISGFTALTERLQRRGREGAEEIARVVSSVFRPAIGAIERRGGSIVSFGGDALFAIFRGQRDARRGIAAARAIEARFADLELATGIGPVRLRARQAVHPARSRSSTSGPARAATTSWSAQWWKLARLADAGEATLVVSGAAGQAPRSPAGSLHSGAGVGAEGHAALERTLRAYARPRSSPSSTASTASTVRRRSSSSRPRATPRGSSGASSAPSS